MVSPGVLKCEKALTHIGTSTIAIGDTANTVLRTRQRVLEMNACTGDPVLPSTDCLTSQDVLSAADRESEIGGIHANAGQPGLNSMGATDADIMLTSVSPTQDTFWYSFLEPLPIDVDFGST